MKKIVAIMFLVAIGIAGGVLLIAGAVLELIEGILSIIFWTIVILIGYFFIKDKIKD